MTRAEAYHWSEFKRKWVWFAMTFGVFSFVAFLLIAPR